MATTTEALLRGEDACDYCLDNVAAHETEAGDLCESCYKLYFEPEQEFRRAA